MKKWIAGFILCVSSMTLFAGEIRKNEPIQPIPPRSVEDGTKVELGKKLFFDPRLSKSGFISCASCHNPSIGGVDGMATSVGHNWHLGPINAPTVLNSKYNFVQFWDGRAANLQEQAGGPIQAAGEMASSHSLAVEVLKSIPQYTKWFREVYGTEKIKIDHVTNAIAAFEETLTTPNSRFDQWLLGDDQAINDTEKAGYQLFKEKGCVGCHMGVGVGGTSFQKFGVVKPYKDTQTLGRYNVTKRESDKYFFKVPLLRNIEQTAPYFHDGSVWTLEEAVNVMAEHQLGLQLKSGENQQIVAFLKTLTGEAPVLTYPILPPSTSSTPKPNRK